LQRRARREFQEPAGKCTGGVEVSTESGPESENLRFARAKEAGKAEENDMNRVELQRILGYLNIGLAIAHDSGVSLGHFGCGDFIQLAQTVNGMLLQSITPIAVAEPCLTAGAGTRTALAGAAVAR
jgi:hypothetical protein